MRIKNLKINSFRGLENIEFNLDESLNVFSGDNRLGKSTIIDSAMWVLCDETLVNGKQDSDNRNMHDLKKELNVIIEFDNGLVLERKYRDIWIEDEDGNLKYSRTDNQFYVNNAKYKKEEYFDFIKETIGLTKFIKTKEFNLLRGIIDYNYYSSIDYKIARKFTEELIDLKTDFELLNQEEFKPIQVDMQVLKYDTGKCANKYKTEFEKVDKEINSKEIIIKSLKETINDEELEKANDLFNERKTLLTDNINLNNDFLALKQLLDENKINIKSEEEKVLKKENEIEKQIQNLMNEGNKLNFEKTSIENEISFLKKTNENIDLTINFLNKQKDELSKNVFEEVVCPNCKEIINKKEKDDFEKTKTNNIQNIENEINAQNEEKENNIKKIKEKEKGYNEKANDFEKCKNEYQKMLKKLEEISKEKENNIKVKELLLEKDDLNNKIKVFINNYETERNNKITDLTFKLDELSSMSKAKKQIKNLQEEIKTLKKQKAYLDMKRELVKEFKNLKRNMIKENTNKVFPNVNIEIIEENENTGSTKDVCYATLKGVEYKAINDGHRYLVGITIIEDIKRALGLQDLPIIFDKFADIGKETLKEIKKNTKSQIITTLVSDNKKILLNNKGE